jgi:hypothetical protein
VDTIVGASVAILKMPSPDAYDCSAVPFLDLGMSSEELHALASRRPSLAPIPPDFLGAWRRAAENAPSKVASDYYRFQLLTGCRGVEICGHKLHEHPPIRVGNVDH